MRLLPAKELNNKIQEQKLSETKAGLFLARKIDALREELQEEQVKHDISIEGMKREYQMFMSEQTSKRGELIKQINELEVKRAELLKPLDEEWNRVNEISEKNKEKSVHLNKIENELSEREKIIERREKDTEISETNSKNTLSEAEKIKEKAQKDYQKSQDILIEAKENEAKIKKSIEIRTKEIEKREATIAYRELDAENRLKNALKKEEANRKETLRIESKQRQLKNAFKELERKNGTI